MQFLITTYKGYHKIDPPSLNQLQIFMQENNRLGRVPAMYSGNLHRTIGQIYTEWNRDLVCILGNNLEVLQINYFYYVCSKLERAISPDSRECMWQVSPATSTPTAVVGFKVQTYSQHCHQFLTPTQNYKTAWLYYQLHTTPSSIWVHSPSQTSCPKTTADDLPAVFVTSGQAAQNWPLHFLNLDLIPS